jgi:hypothetical protein
MQYKITKNNSKLVLTTMRLKQSRYVNSEVPPKGHILLIPEYPLHFIIDIPKISYAET